MSERITNGDTYSRISRKVYNKALDLTRITQLRFTVPRKVQYLSGVGSARSVWAKVIEAPSPPDPYAVDGSTEYYGKGYYIMRLDGAQYEDWEANKEPPYELNDMVRDPDTDRVYTMINDNSGGIQYPELPPHENKTDWAIFDEIKIEYAEGWDKENEEIPIANLVPVFRKGEIVRIIRKNVVVNQQIIERWYLAHTLLYVGEPEERTLAMYENKVMAVYQ